jgi:uncharacterized protein YecE (DUF72 family)
MDAKMTSRLWAGTSGLVLPLPNKKAFPEAFRDRPRLAYYAQLYNSIELNSTFYKIPLPGTFTRWTTEAAGDFTFTVKLWRGITHVRGLRFNPADVSQFLQSANHLGTKKGCLLIQLPPGLQAGEAGRLDDLLTVIRRFDPDRPWKLAVEFRHHSWYTSGVDTILSYHHAAKVLQDMPASVLSELSAAQLAIPFVYIRFHGPAGDYRGGYAPNVLATWAGKIDGWLSAGKEVFVYFNNTIGDALADLGRLRELLPRF